MAVAPLTPDEVATLLAKPRPGLYPDLPMDDYLALAAVSSSQLGLLAAVPAKLRAALDGYRRPDTPATLLGTAIHTAILQPDLFRATYVKAEQCLARVASGKRKGQRCTNAGTRYNSAEGWRCGQHALEFEAEPVTPLGPSDWACCMGLRDNALSRKAQYHNPRARKLLRVRGSQVEMTGMWRDPATGHLAKLRGDHLAPTLFCTDIKSTDDASKRAFAGKVASFGYYRQQGLYNMGLNSADIAWGTKWHVLMACEKVPPYLIATYQVDDNLMQLARAEARKLLDVYHHCTTTGNWPGYPARLMPLGLNHWDEKRLRASLNLEV